MDLTRETEALGQSVNMGLLTLNQATDTLVDFADGRLTPLGAEDMIRNWTTVRSRYTREMRRAEDGIKKYKQD